jgi:hypothetical protein
MDILSSLLISALLLIAALALMYWHVSSWRKAQTSDLAADELDFYRRQFRRRIQTSALLAVLAIMIFVGELLGLWITSRLFLIIYWAAALVLVAWVCLLAAADVWATKYHFGQLRQKCLIEQAKLHAEVRRVQAIRGNGKPLTTRDEGSGIRDQG